MPTTNSFPHGTGTRITRPTADGTQCEKHMAITGRLGSQCIACYWGYLSDIFQRLTTKTATASITNATIFAQPLVDRMPLIGHMTNHMGTGELSPVVGRAAHGEPQSASPTKTSILAYFQRQKQRLALTMPLLGNCTGNMRASISRSVIAAMTWWLLTNTPCAADSSLQYVTGYTCDPAHGQPYCGATASGAMVGPGVAACPYRVSLGTPVVVHFQDGDVAAVCHDRYASYLSARYDVWWPTVEACYSHTGWFRVEVG